MKPSLRTFSTFIALAGCAGALQAQSVPLFNSFDSHVGLMWPTDDWGTAAFTRTAVGDFTGEGLRDVATLSGDRVVLSWNIAHHSFEQLLPTTSEPLGGVNDIDTCDGGTGVARDTVAFVDDNGLGCFVFSQTLNEFEALMVASGSWVDAKRVTCGYINGGDVVDFAGVTADQLHVLWRIGGTVPPEQYDITLTVTVLDVALVHWSSTSRRDLAVLTTEGIRIYASNQSPTNPPVYSHQRGGSATAVTMTVLPAASGSSGLEGVALIYAASSPTARELYVYADEAANDILSIVTLPSVMNFVGIAAGDADNDGDADLVMAQKRELGPLFLKNNGGSTPFTAPGNWTPNLLIDQRYAESAGDDPLRGPDAGTNESVPVFTDFTDDGKADLVLALPDTPGESVAPAHIFLENVPPQTSGPKLLSLNFQRPGQLYATSPASGPIAIGGYVAFRTDIPAFDPTKANAVRITVHCEETFGSIPFALGVSECVTSLQSLIDSTEVDFYDDRPTAIVAIAAPFEAEADWDDDVPTVGTPPRREIFWIEVQPVKISVAGGGYSIIQGWSTRLAAVASDERDICEFDEEQAYPALMHGQGWGCPYQAGTWSAVGDTDSAFDDTCYEEPGPSGGQILAPVIIARRRLPPGAAGTWDEYPSDTFLTGTVSPYEPLFVQQ